MADADVSSVRAADAQAARAADVPVHVGQVSGPATPARRALRSGSLSRRMIGIAAAWVLLLLVGGGIALDRVLVSAVTQNFDDQLDYVQTAMIASAETDPDG